jgi:hypothetical protein
VNPNGIQIIQPSVDAQRLRWESVPQISNPERVESSSGGNGFNPFRVDFISRLPGVARLHRCNAGRIDEIPLGFSKCGGMPNAAAKLFCRAEFFRKVTHRTSSPQAFLT